MATVRRILIAIVGLALMADSIALAYVKFTSGPSPSDEKSKLVLWIDDAAQAQEAGEICTEQGYEAVVSPAKRQSQQEADFRVAMSGTEKVLKPIAQTLKQAGHGKQISLSEDGTKLFYGGYYKQKAEAMRQAERIKAQEKMVFEVVPGVKTVQKASNKVVIASMPSNMVEPLISEIVAKGVEINDQNEVSLTPKEEPGDEAVEEE
jgi:hypothetical protein